VHPRILLLTPALIGLAAVALLTAGCRSGSRGVASTAEAGALAWTHCMRSHGVLDLPDQSSSNIKIPTAQQLGVSSSLLQTAENDCKQLLPNGGQPPSQAEQRQQLSAMRLFAECMRAHWVSDWPDPTIGPGGKPRFDLLDLQPPLDPDSPQAQSATRECGHLAPKAVGGIPVEAPNP
jgi:hypothetical protein